MGEEAGDVGIVAAQAPILVPERVHGTDGTGRLADLVEQRQHGLLVRNRDVAAGEFPGSQTSDEARQLRRIDIDALIGAVQPMLREPASMDERRARMRDGMADDEAAWRHGGALSDVSGPAGRDRARRPERGEAAGREW